MPMLFMSEHKVDKTKFNLMIMSLKLVCGHYEYKEYKTSDEYYGFYEEDGETALLSIYSNGNIFSYLYGTNGKERAMQKIIDEYKYETNVR